jgi:hypothetical protein
LQVETYHWGARLRKACESFYFIRYSDVNAIYGIEPALIKYNDNLEHVSNDLSARKMTAHWWLPNLPYKRRLAVEA